MNPPEKKGTAGYQIYSLEEHARSKGMWAGTLKKAAIADLLGVRPAPPGSPEDAPPFRLEKIVREHTPALLKIIDEGVVNASDHKKEHEREKRAVDRVKRISLDFDRSTGKVTIENDGPGIPIIVHEGASRALGRQVYVPEVAFSMFLAGRNMEKPPDCVKGGVNGIGGKLMNVHSTSFAVETVCDGEFYIQAFGDRMRTRAPPKVFGVRTSEACQLSAERKRPHTRITFVPAYAELGYALGPKGELATQDAEDLDAWCRWRMFLLAAYVGPKVETLYNGVICPTTSAGAIAALAVAHDPEAIIMGLTAKAPDPPYSDHPWDVAVAVLPNAAKFGQISVVNGVNCAKGAHVTYLKKVLNEAAGAKLAKATKAKKDKATGEARKTSVADTCKQVFMVMVGALPGADWGGQRKDELQISETKLRSYAFAPTSLGRVATAIADNLLRSAERGARGPRKKRVEADKYTRARLEGGKDAASCRLLLGEGDSAISLLRSVLTLGKKNPGGPSFEKYGVMSLGGVIMNAMKKVSEVETAAGESIMVRSQQLRDNKVLKALVEILGLDFACAYQTAAERDRLRYGGVIICTDQDLDGTGKILCLVLVWFHLFWPALIRAGYVKRLMTPVIRAYPKPRGDPLEFAYEDEFACWAGAQGGGEAVLRNYAVKYYKGLGSHDEDEVLRIARRFEDNVYTFTLDDGASELFEVYFGTRPGLRKAALSTPVAHRAPEAAQAIHASREISCGDQLEVDAKAYKLDDIQRKIPGLDGLPVARRKVLAGALRRFAANNREIKVFQLGGYIAEHMFYHHGDASLNGTIIGMAQRFPGALHYPYLVGIGQFGSRHLGGHDAASARYISVRLAAPFAKAVFPAEDTWLLPHVFEDGERAQPRYFVPVLPTALLESFDIPSEGWRHKSFARDFDQVVALVRAYVAGDPLVARVAAAAEAGGLADLAADVLGEFYSKYPLDVSLAGYGEHLAPEERAELVREYRGYRHSFGWYHSEHPPAGSAKGSTIRVTELPIGVSTEGFIKGLQKAGRTELIDTVTDESSGAQVDIAIRLVPGGWDTITEKYGGAEVDPIEDFLLLRASLKPFLNYYSPEGGVLEFGDNYHALLLRWVPLRRNLYEARLRREALLLRLKAELESWTIKYIEAGLDLAKEADEQAAAAVLSEKGFPLFDSGLLASPRYTPVDELESLVLRGPGAGYAYILDLREKELIVAAKTKRVARVAGIRQRLAEVEALLAESPFPGASVWSAEIDEVVAAVARGEKTRWRF